MIGDYTNANARVDFGCSKGHRWVVSAGAVVSGRGCPHCSGVAKLSKEVVNERIARRGLVMVGDYKTVTAKSLFQCEKGHTFRASPSSILQNHGCPKCADKTLSKEVVNERIKDRGITMIGEYKNGSTKTRFQCSNGHVWSIYPSHILSGSGCPCCATYGYKTKRPGFLYVFHLIRGDVSAIGFGVSTNFRKRYSDHRVTFRKTRTQAKLIAKIEFKTGWGAREAEYELKQHPAIMDFGIEGFRTECLPIEYKDFVLETISQHAISQ